MYYIIKSSTTGQYLGVLKGTLAPDWSSERRDATRFETMTEAILVAGKLGINNYQCLPVEQ